MIGQAYFDLRAQLGKDLFQLAQIVREHGGSVDDTHIIENIIASLDDPFIFVVVGEVNTGKSTFLNALFGADFSRTGVMPTTDKVYFFKHGPVVRSVPVTPTLEEVHVPCAFLRDFHIVDTPGTNSIESEHQQITERFVPAADLIVFVFSAMNPWGASAWQFLDKVHRHWLRNVIFVLQQSDLRTAEEIQVISDYMRQLCQQRYGREFPLFAVSAKRAFLARTSGLDPEKLMADSGFIPLERHINEIVSRQPARVGKLQSSLRLALQILDKLIDDNALRLRNLHERRMLLNEMIVERDVQVQRTLGKFLLALDASDHDYHVAAGRIVQAVIPRLTVRAAFGARAEDDRLPPNLDHRLNQDLLTHAGERWHQMAAVLADDFRRFENYMSHHWKGELYLSELKGKDDAEAASEEAHRRFIGKVDSTLRRFVLGIHIEDAMQPGLAQSRQQARKLPWIIGLALAACAGAWAWKGWPVGVAALGATALLSLVLLWSIRSTLQRTVQSLIRQFEAARPVLRQMLTDHANSETERAFAIFTRILQPSGDDVNAQDARARSQAEKLFALQLSLQHMAARLKPGH